jgi:hypothetical protein
MAEARERKRLRRFFTWTVLGALTGVVVATLVAPMILRTLLASTGAQDAMCQCAQLVDNTSSLLIRTQVWGLLSGAALFPTGDWLVRLLWRRRKARKATASPAPAPAPAAPERPEGK